MYDPVRLAEETLPLVAEGHRRKYYRFRAARFYGGIATADCVGCCLRCAFCWAYDRAANPERPGSFFSPEQAAARIAEIARRHRLRRARLSGNEPTLAREHLLDLLGRLPRSLGFMLETNGILIGHDAGYAAELATFENLHVRVSLKGSTPEEFQRLTGADPGAFRLPLQALENLLRAGVSCHAAAMMSFSPPEARSSLRRILREIHPSLADLEEEDAFFNQAIERRLGEAGVTRASR